MFPVMTAKGGQCMAFPDTCMTPGVSAGAPGPLPYPNIAMGSDGNGSSKVTFENKAVLRKGDSISTSSGDEAGNSPGSVVNSKMKGKSEVMLGWMQVQVEGKDVGYLTSMVGQNGCSAAGAPPGLCATPGGTAVMVTVSMGMGSGGGSVSGAGVSGPQVSTWDSSQEIYGTPDGSSPDCSSPNQSSQTLADLQAAADGSDRKAKAAKGVMAWLSEHAKPEYYKGILGEDGGGGFVSGQVTTKVVKAGTVVYRYFGGDADPCGSWWSPYPLNNPVADNALPEGNTGQYMAVGVVQEDTEVLCGPGAPRCSNKPGGPPQYYFPFGSAEIKSSTATISVEVLEAL